MSIEENLSRTLNGFAHDPRFSQASFADVVRFVIEAASEAMECRRVSAWRYVPGPPSAIHCVSLWDAQTRQHCDGMALGERDAASYLASLQRDAVLVMDDVYSDTGCIELAREYLPLHGISSMLDAPFLFDNELAGVVCFEHVGER